MRRGSSPERMAQVRAARVYLRFDPLLRFRSLTRRDGDCWIWNGCVSRFGSPLFSIPSAEPGGRYRNTLALTFAYRQFVGPVEAPARFRNTCGSPLCVNPTHWRPKSESPAGARAGEKCRP